jgi:hypothetical protein
MGLSDHYQIFHTCSCRVRYDFSNLWCWYFTEQMLKFRVSNILGVLALQLQHYHDSRCWFIFTSVAFHCCRTLCNLNCLVICRRILLMSSNGVVRRRLCVKVLNEVVEDSILTFRRIKDFAVVDQNVSRLYIFHRLHHNASRLKVLCKVLYPPKCYKRLFGPALAAGWQTNSVHVSVCCQL